MKIASAIEAGTLTKRLFVGVENFHVTAVNPTMAELNAMGIRATEEPVYYGKADRDFGQGVKPYEYFNIRAFLDNKDVANPIKTQVQYTVYKDVQEASTGKVSVINRYGGTTWLEREALETGVLPNNMQWFVTDGMRESYRGEGNLIFFVKALRNLPNVNKNTSKQDKEKGVAMFTLEDLDNMFAGNFKDIRKIILDSSDQKVGFMLGVNMADGKYYQTLYTRMPLKPYVRATNATQYIVENIRKAQAAGSYSTIYFDLDDTQLKEFDPSSIVVDQTVTSGSNDADDDLPF